MTSSLICFDSSHSEAGNRRYRFGLVAVLGGKLDASSNSRVSGWIADHLRVVIAPTQLPVRAVTMVGHRGWHLETATRSSLGDPPWRAVTRAADEPLARPPGLSSRLDGKHQVNVRLVQALGPAIACPVLLVALGAVCDLVGGANHRAERTLRTLAPRRYGAGRQLASR